MLAGRQILWVTFNDHSWMSMRHPLHLQRGQHCLRLGLATLRWQLRAFPFIVVGGLWEAEDLIMLLHGACGKAPHRLQADQVIVLQPEQPCCQFLVWLPSEMEIVWVAGSMSHRWMSLMDCALQVPPQNAHTSLHAQKQHAQKQYAQSMLLKM